MENITEADDSKGSKAAAFYNVTKEKGHLDQLLRSLHSQITSFKSETGFFTEEVKEKNKAIRTLLRRNSCKSKSSSL